MIDDGEPVDGPKVQARARIVDRNASLSRTPFRRDPQTHLANLETQVASQLCGKLAAKPISPTPVATRWQASITCASARY